MNKKLQTKDIKPLYERLLAMEPIASKVTYGDFIEIETGRSFTKNSEIYELAKALSPWRKGPFRIDEFEIQSEWNSYIKFDILAPHIDIEGKTVVDIGANNGYYSFRMEPYKPKQIIAIDPWAIFYLQFLFINKFIDSNIVDFRLIGMEDMADEGIKACLNDGGELIIDNLVILKEGHYALCPPTSYAKMSNAYFIPSIDTMMGWIARAGFVDCELIGVKKTELSEQRKTEWINGLSLDSFLDPNDDTKTIEGFDAPVRAYFKCKKRGK